MKLLAKTNRIYLAFSLVIYLFAGLAFYQVVRFLIYKEVESRLRVERLDFENYIQIHRAWSDSTYFIENKIDVVPAGSSVQKAEMFIDTLIRNRYDNELMPFRQLTFYTTIQGKMHRVAIRKSLIQSYQLIEVITVTMAACLGLLLLGTFWFQGKLSGRLWHPFYETLSRIKRFNLASATPLQLDKPEINEFRELNEVLRKMGDKMQQDYRSLKEFTENASHEIQTPLALINAKVEQLIQSEKLTETQTRWIEDIYQASRRMARLNQGLLLLAKIENQQFTHNQTIDLAALLAEKLDDMEEVLHHKRLSVQSQNNIPFEVQLPMPLAESLVMNLVNNAIKHNYPDGRLELVSDGNQLWLGNTGSPLTTNPERLFERFKKEGSGPDSVGLGLAIIKEICDNYGLRIRYEEHNGWHRFCISRKPEEA
ncbi:signal transduction histidine kinase [Larkinella arboricola]|uniref:histidine kinase n=1 Tax=Larkinella arboricola TaxID=643671 RepID=A0A327X815_LARAB|nr:HAMP domain-containing sensor histidine kinase [Larkinella arboricola]RAK02358.1 signal transduction histidine kinase [Larkinella arboricola]